MFPVYVFGLGLFAEFFVSSSAGTVSEEVRTI